MFVNLKSLLVNVSLPFVKKYPLVGVDFGWDELRLLQLEKRAGSFHIEKMLSYRGNMRSLEQSAAGLQTVVRRENLQGYPVAFALPSSVILKKQIELPYFKDEELMGELTQDFNRHFPDLPEEKVHFDFVAKPVTEEMLSILLVAARKESLEQLIKVARQVSLKAKIVDVDLYALARAAAFYFHPRLEREKLKAAVLNLEWPAFSLIVFTAEDLVFHHQWCVDRAVFEKPLQAADQLMQQLRRAWQLCLATHPKLKIDLLGISGEITQLDELACYFQRQLSREVKIINPFLQMTYSSSLQRETICHLAPRFLLCCGLALRHDYN